MNKISNMTLCHELCSIGLQLQPSLRSCCSILMVSPLLCRSFNTEASQNDSNRSVDVDRCSDTSLSRPTRPFLRGLSQVLNWVDQLMDDPFSTMAPIIEGGGPKRARDAKEDENALYLRMDMSGLSKDAVKVTVEQNTLIIKGEASEAAESVGRRYVSRLELPPNVYKLDSIKAEMKNGVLRLVLPKVKDKERKGCFPSAS